MAWTVYRPRSLRYLMNATKFSYVSSPLVRASRSLRRSIFLTYRHAWSAVVRRR